MEAPGEQFLMKMWDTLIDKGIGGLLEPYQIKRLSKARAEAKKDELLLIAKAEKQVELIKSGSDDSIYLLGTEKRVEPYIGELSTIDICRKTETLEQIRKEVNVAKAIVVAEDELCDDKAPPNDDPLNDDWIYTWRDNAGKVSDEELQTLWGKVLAGEIKQPGTFSVRTLEFLKCLSKEEAKVIETVSRFILKGSIFWEHKDLILERSGLNFVDLLNLEELNVLSGVAAGSLTTSCNSLETDRYIYVANSLNDRAVVLQCADPNFIFKQRTSVLAATRLGHELFKLGNFQVDETYLLAVARSFKTKGVDKVFIASVVRVQDGIEFELPVEVAPNQPNAIW